MNAEFAKLILLRQMESLSEERWCAGWMSGIEYELWADSDPALRALAEDAGGWWAWPEECKSVTFFPLPEWQRMFEQHMAIRNIAVNVHDGADGQASGSE